MATKLMDKAKKEKADEFYTQLKCGIIKSNSKAR